MKLLDCKTRHPGGWRDIVDGIKTKWPGLDVDVRQAMWGSTNVTVTKRGKEEVTLIYRPNRVEDSVGRYVLWQYLEAVEHPCSGLMASDAYRILMHGGFPVPGDKEWLLPSLEWERKDAKDR